MAVVLDGDPALVKWAVQRSPETESFPGPRARFDWGL